MGGVLRRGRARGAGGDARGGAAGAKQAEAFSTAEQTAMRQFLKGNSLYEKREWAEAVDAYSDGLEAQPDFARAYHGRGLGRLQLALLEDALEDFTLAIKHSPDWPLAYLSRASAHSELANVELAVADCTKAIGLWPDDARAYKVRAGLYQAAGEMEKALEDFEKAGLIEQNKTCVVCLEAARDTRLHPCLHAGLCRDCANGLLAKHFPCPLCGSKIERIEDGSFESTFCLDDLKKLTSTKTEVRPDEALSDIRESNTGELSLEGASSAPSTPGVSSAPPGAEVGSPAEETPAAGADPATAEAEANERQEEGPAGEPPEEAAPPEEGALDADGDANVDADADAGVDTGAGAEAGADGQG